MADRNEQLDTDEVQEPALGGIQFLTQPIRIDINLVRSADDLRDERVWSKSASAKFTTMLLFKPVVDMPLLAGHFL